MLDKEGKVMSGSNICIRCGGYVITDYDHYGWYEQCIQCGYQRDVPSTSEVRDRSENTRGKELIKRHKYS